MPHFNQLTPSQDERLTILIEECSEVIKAACKIQRHGYESRDPTNPNHQGNRLDLEEEIANVSWAIAALVSQEDVSERRVDEFVDQKMKSNQYTHHQGVS